jgi:hypothetical protein
MTPEQRQELIDRVCRCLFEVANQNPYNPDALKEAGAVVDQIITPLVERAMETIELKKRGAEAVVMLQDLIDGGEECRGMDSAISGVIRKLEWGK